MKTHEAKNTDDLDETSSDLFSIVPGACHKEYKVRLGYEISGDVGEYFELLSFFDKLGSSDAVNLYVTNCGGCCHTGITICNAMHTCKAPITTLVTGPSYSMASVIALSGDALLMYPDSMLMFHNYSGLHYGKGGEVKMAMEEWQYHWRSVMYNRCHPFLSKREIEAVLHDKDVYVHADAKNLRTRVKRHFGGNK